MRRALLAMLVLVAGTGVAFAHPGHDNAGLVAGFLHPLTGMDHLLAMIAVGLLAVTAGSRLALVAMPAAFVATMAVGAAFGAAGYGTPWTENLVAGSLVVLGALVAWARPLPLAAIVPLIAVFAFFHGMAHGAELPAVGGLAFGLGAVAATALLHVAGIALGLTANRFAASPLVRHGGLATAAIGGILLLGLA